MAVTYHLYLPIEAKPTREREEAERMLQRVAPPLLLEYYAQARSATAWASSRSNRSSPHTTSVRASALRDRFVSQLLQVVLEPSLNLCAHVILLPLPRVLVVPSRQCTRSVAMVFSQALSDRAARSPSASHSAQQPPCAELA